MVELLLMMPGKGALGEAEITLECRVVAAQPMETVQVREVWLDSADPR